MPGYEKDIKNQFQLLAEYILPKIDHEDSQENQHQQWDEQAQLQVEGNLDGGHQDDG